MYTIHSVENEDFIIGSILLRPDKLTLIDFLPAEAFYSEHHKIIYQIMIDLSEAFEEVTYMTVFNEIRHQKLEEAIPIKFLVHLTLMITRTKSFAHVAKIIFEDYLKRKTILLLKKGIRSIRDKEDIGIVIEFLQDKLFESTNFKVDGENIHISEVAEKYIHDNQNNLIVNYKTGFSCLDENISISPGDLIILAAGPSHGKTAAALNLALNFIKQNIPTAIFSLEMSNTQVSNRIMSNFASIKNSAFKYKLQTANLSKYGQYLQQLKNMLIYLNDRAALNIIQLRGHLKRMIEKYGIKIAIIDYLQLMSNVKNTSSREQEVAAITRGLKCLAKEFNIPIIALSQFSREFDKQKRKPRLSDLRESGAIEQDADLVLLLYNYAKVGLTEFNNLVAFINAKNRHGNCFETSINFDGDYQRFYEENQNTEMPF